MTHLEIKRLIDKYLEGSCSEEEKKHLDGFLDSYQEESNGLACIRRIQNSN